MSRRTRIYGIAGLAAALAAAAFAPAIAAETIAVIALEGTAQLGTRIESDTTVSTEGAASIKVSTAWPTVVNLAEIVPPAIDDVTLVFEADVRSDGLEGRAFLEMWCHFPDKGAFFGRGLDTTVTGTSDWQRLRAVFYLQPGQRPSRVTLNLVVEGHGTVWVDNARLLSEPLP
jgi:hypothetical protein